MRLLARAPNHLGDGVMAIPALRALAGLGPLTVQAPGWGRELYAELGVTLAPPGPAPRLDAAVLFPPSLRVALQALPARRRIGTPTDLRRPLLTDVVPESTHRAETYAALAAVLGARAEGPPTFTGRAPAPAVPEGHIGLNPVSASGEVVEWRGFRALADRLGRPVVFYGGPGEAARVAAVAGPHPTRVGMSLPAFASALERCAVFVSNDSGAAHFARAVGVPTVVVYGSTRPERTGPAGAAAVVGPSVACAPCYRKRCASRPRLLCLGLTVESVQAAVEACVA